MSKIGKYFHLPLYHISYGLSTPYCALSQIVERNLEISPVILLILAKSVIKRRFYRVIWPVNQGKSELF